MGSLSTWIRNLPINEDDGDDSGDGMNFVESTDSMEWFKY